MRTRTIIYRSFVNDRQTMSSCLVATDSASSSADITAINLIMQSMNLEDPTPQSEPQPEKTESKPAGAAVPVQTEVNDEKKVTNTVKKEEPVVLADISKSTGWASSEEEDL